MTDPSDSSSATDRDRPDESDDELAARAVLEANLSCTLVRVAATFGREFPDYRTPGGDKVIEVKRITSQEFHAMGDAQVREETDLDDTRLTGTWMVLVQRPGLSTTLPQRGGLPIFRDAAPTRLKNIAADLVEHFAVLERHGRSRSGPVNPWISLLGGSSLSHRSPPEPHMPAELAAAMRTIEARIAGPFHYFRGDARPGRPGSISVLPMLVSYQTGLADTLVDRLDQWFASEDSTNLRKSLSHDPPDTERIAFLVFDVDAEPEIRSAQEQGSDFCPTRAPALPAEVDVVWILVGPVACRYHPQDGWTARLAPGPAATL
jgi:hypothetical protein